MREAHPAAAWCLPLIFNYLLIIHLLVSTCSGSMHETSCDSMRMIPAISSYKVLFIYLFIIWYLIGSMREAAWYVGHSYFIYYLLFIIYYLLPPAAAACVEATCGSMMAAIIIYLVLCVYYISVHLLFIYHLVPAASAWVRHPAAAWCMP
jgi:hypothetical protein